MSRIWSFHGGIHPQENKQQSLTVPLRQLPLPERLILPLQQHIGAPATPLVQVGDKVLKGQRIAEPSGFVSIFMHAPTSGTVVEIADYPVPHASGMRALCIVIETDGEERWIERRGVDDFRTLEKSQLAEIIRCAGIAGMGGAGFPTDIKLHLSDDHIVNTLIINGVECEPYITADDMLMRERAERIIGGIEIAAHLIKPTHILVGIEDNKPQAAVAMTAAARQSELAIEVVVVPTKYPSGGERQLITLLTGVEVPHGQLPADIGIVVQNVGTMAAVYDAVHEGTPLISRITTLTGDALAAAGNIEVLLGTPVAEVLDFCGLQPEQLSRLIMGGPMMGFTLSDPQVPLIKTSNCIIAGSLEEFPPPPPAQNCIRCGACEQVCPAELLPQQLHWFAKGKEFDKALSHNLMDCIECGACSYVCPSNIPLVQYYRYAKSEIRQEQQEQRKAEQARIRFEARQARLEAAQQEKEQRRKARAEAAARNQAKKRDPVAALSSDKAAADSDPVARLKQLKTEAAIARTKLKKAEKALQQAQQDGSTDLEPLRQQLASAEQHAQQAQAALTRAESAAPTPTAPSLNELKVAAAVARTKVSKTEQALADAEARGAASADKLKASLQQLRVKADQAQLAFTTAEKGQSPTAGAAGEAPVSQSPRDSKASKSAADTDLKALKTAAAVLRTKLKKTEKALAEALKQDSAAAGQLQTALDDLRAKAMSAEQALEQAQARQQAPQSPQSAEI